MIAILFASIFAPTILAVVFFLAFRKWQNRHGRTLSTAGRRIHGAGEQLRKKIEDDTEKMLLGYLSLFFIGPYLVAAWALTQVNLSSVAFKYGDWFYVVCFVAMTVSAISVVIRYGTSRLRGLAGLKAEMYTAQELNRLIGDGCVVLHDVPGDGFNLDHVVISPTAVYVVETKAVRKPRDSGKNDHYKVRQTGDTLRFPHFTTSAPIFQARQYAQWLARYLRDATQQTVPVYAAVSLPGWFIDSERSNDPAAVRAFTPAGRAATFMTEVRGRVLDEPTKGLITQAILLRYPVSD